LNLETAKVQRAGHSVLHEMIDVVIHKICPPIESETSSKKKSTKIKLAE
jgi:nitric oxide reductase NorQ protein